MIYLHFKWGGGYSKSEVDTLLNGKADTSHTHTKSQITDFPTIPSKTSELTNDSGFLTSHQDLSGYVPKSGGAVSGNIDFDSTWNYASSNQGWFPNTFNWYAGNTLLSFISIYDDIRRQIVLNVLDHNGVMKSVLSAGIDESNNIIVISDNKKLATQDDTVPRSGGAVLDGQEFKRTVNNSTLNVYGGQGYSYGAFLQLTGRDDVGNGEFNLQAHNGSTNVILKGKADGTLVWNGQSIQTVSDQRLKQQISNIDDALLDAWQNVEPVQFKYNDAVNEKGDKARLHTGYVVQQINEACQKHNIDISEYGLFCHEEYPERTEEVTIENEDGTTTKETKVIEEAKEHYSLRYTETLVVECAFLRRENAKLKQQFKQLEETVNELKSSINYSEIPNS